MILIIKVIFHDQKIVDVIHGASPLTKTANVQCLHYSCIQGFNKILKQVIEITRFAPLHQACCYWSGPDF